MSSSGNVLKARCDATGLVIRMIFWIYAVYLVIMLGIGFYMISRPGNEFSLRLLDTGNGLAGYGFYCGNLEVDFARGALSEAALHGEKLIYLTGYFCGFGVKWLYLAVLWQVAGIFKSIDRDTSPFVRQCCRKIFSIGVLIIAAGFVRNGLFANVLGIMHVLGISEAGLARSGNSPAWFGYLLAGVIVICLSYIFEYGMNLQIESDETL